MSRKDKISFFISMLLLTIFIAILILAFCWFCYELPIDFPGTVGEWITALASLAGGALTLGGVWWTIKDTEAKRKEDMYASQKPFLKIASTKSEYSPNDFCSNAKWKIKIYINYNENSTNFTAIKNNFLTKIELKNVGLGIAKNILFTDFNYSFIKITDINSSKKPKKLFHKLNIDYLYKIPYLLNNDSEKIPIIFLADSNEVTSQIALIHSLKTCSLKGTVKINYSDCYNNWFSQKMIFSFIISYTSNYGISIDPDYIYLEDVKKEEDMQLLIDKIYLPKSNIQFKQKQNISN